MVMNQLQRLLRPTTRTAQLLAVPATGGLFLAAAFATTAISAGAMATVHRTWPTKPYLPRHQTWPYQSSDFSRQDESPDPSFYSEPRFVTHIDDAAIDSLREYYASVLPAEGNILDICSSWVSHYPKTVLEAVSRNKVRVIGMGMNRAELEANDVLNHGRLLVDLNVDPNLAKLLTESKLVDAADATGLLDASTMVVSIDYLTQPVQVLSSLLSVTKSGGSVHLTVSNRCFPTKAINRWLRISEEERLMMVADFLHFAGWKQIELVELSNGKEAGQPSDFVANDFRALVSMFGIKSRDPLWIVRAVKA